jgi:hypothetical protein
MSINIQPPGCTRACSYCHYRAGAVAKLATSALMRIFICLLLRWRAIDIDLANKNLGYRPWYVPTPTPEYAITQCQCDIKNKLPQLASVVGCFVDPHQQGHIVIYWAWAGFGVRVFRHIIFFRI